MTEKRFTNIEHDYENAWIKCNDNGDFMIYAIYKELDEGLPALEDLMNGLAEENEKLKQFKEKVFTLIDKEIARNEKAIEWGKETGADSSAMGFYNHMLKRLQKELQE